MPDGVAVLTILLLGHFRSLSRALIDLSAPAFISGHASCLVPAGRGFPAEANRRGASWKGVERQLGDHALAAVSSGDVVVEPGPIDALGNLEASAARQVVLSVPSPEPLRHEAAEVRRIIRPAGADIVRPLLGVVAEVFDFAWLASEVLVVPIWT